MEYFSYSFFYSFCSFTENAGWTFWQNFYPRLSDVSPMSVDWNSRIWIPCASSHIRFCFWTKLQQNLTKRFFSEFVGMTYYKRRQKYYTSTLDFIFWRKLFIGIKLALNDKCTKTFFLNVQVIFLGALEFHQRSYSPYMCIQESKIIVLKSFIIEGHTNYTKDNLGCLSKFD